MPAALPRPLSHAPRPAASAALQSLNPTITQVRNQLANLYPSGNGSSSTAQLKAAPAGAGANGSSAPLSRAAVVTAQAEAAAREVNVSRRQADAQRWIAAWRSRSRGNLKAAAAAVAADQQQHAMLGLDPDRISQVGAGPDLSALQPMPPPPPPSCPVFLSLAQPANVYPARLASARGASYWYLARQQCLPSAGLSSAEHIIRASACYACF